MTDEAKWIVDELREYAKNYAHPYYCGGRLIGDTVRIMEQAANMIEKLSEGLESNEQRHSRDAVPVIRCRECIHRGDSSTCPMCVDGYNLTEDNGFCHTGEKDGGASDGKP